MPQSVSAKKVSMSILSRDNWKLFCKALVQENGSLGKNSFPLT